MALATSTVSTFALGNGSTGQLHCVRHIGAKRSGSRCASSSCSWGQSRGQRLNEELFARRQFGRLHTSSPPPPPLKDRSDSSLGAIRDLDGSSREDNESMANNHLSTKTELPRKKNASVLKSIIQQIEPLDISLISRDVSPDSSDAMKRTISGMLGLLPSDQFQVIIESSKEPLAQLLVSSMMTGYTLQNGEYRLCLHRSLENTAPYVEKTERDIMEMVSPVGMEIQLTEDMSSTIKLPVDTVGVEDRVEHITLPDELGAVSPEVAHYIQQLQAKLAATSKELEECKHSLTTVEMERMAGEKTNDLLDYLQSLEPEKVAELSKPTCPELENVITEVVDGVLANLSLDQASTAPSFPDGMNSIGSWKETNSSEVRDRFSLQFQSNFSTSRDHLARLLFWCMLLGHYMRAVEYRLELSRTLSL